MTAKDLGLELKQTASMIGRTRKRLCGTSGGDISEEEVDILKEYFNTIESKETRKELEELVKPQFVFGIVTYVRDNHRRVEVRIKPNLERAVALMPIGIDLKKLILKTIKLEVIDYEGVRYYRSEFLSGRAWKN